MNKQDLATIIAEKAGIDYKKAYAFIGTFTDTVAEALANGEKVQLVGFGTFETRERAARIGHNPQTGGSVKIPAKTAPAFKAGKALKDAVNK